MSTPQGAADPALQPELGAAFRDALARPGVNAHDFAYITSPLREAVMRSWPYDPSSWTTADGGTDASALVLRALTTREHPVAVEQPTSQRTMALLRSGRRTVVGVAWDVEGPDPDQLRDAIASRRARVFYWQPRAHYPTGRTPCGAGRVRRVLVRPGDRGVHGQRPVHDPGGVRGGGQPREHLAPGAIRRHPMMPGPHRLPRPNNAGRSRHAIPHRYR